LYLSVDRSNETTLPPPQVLDCLRRVWTIFSGNSGRREGGRDGGMEGRTEKKGEKKGEMKCTAGEYVRESIG